jgi:hypothetical protein
VGVLVAAALVNGLAVSRERRFEDLALAEGTVPVYASVDGHAIHCQGVEEAEPCLSGHRSRGGRPAVLWLGNSQLHAVNQHRPGDEPAAPVLFRVLAAQGRDLLTFSLPNASLQEHLVLFAYLLPRLPLETLLLPLVFDDTRETGLRASIARALTDPTTVALLEDTEVGRSILAQHQQSGDGDLAALDETVQERSEVALNGWLEEHSQLWSLRPKLRGTLFVHLYNLRNTLLGITPQSKRRVIPGRLERNLAAGAAILAEAQARGIATLVYVVPLRDDVEPPYVAAEYTDFKQRARQLAERHGARFADLQALVPAALWGRKQATDLDGVLELDFMHFQAGGHALLAERLAELVQTSPRSPRS